MTEQDIIKKYLGIPFVNHGRSMQGVDCWGLMILVYKDLGYDLIDVKDNYDRQWYKQGKNYFIEHSPLQWSKIEKPILFDGVVFKNKQGVAVHCGVILSDMRFIHAKNKAGVIVSTLYDNEYGHCVEGYYHLKGLN